MDLIIRYADWFWCFNSRSPLLEMVISSALFFFFSFCEVQFISFAGATFDVWLVYFISISCSDSDAAVGKFCCRTIGMFTMFWMQTWSKFSHRFVIVSIFIEYLNNFVLVLESSLWIRSAIIVLNYIYYSHYSNHHNIGSVSASVIFMLFLTFWFSSFPIKNHFIISHF